jgi:hypothetical protein
MQRSAIAVLTLGEAAMAPLQQESDPSALAWLAVVRTAMAAPAISKRTEFFIVFLVSFILGANFWLPSTLIR